MKKLVFAASMSLAAMTATAHAADLDREIGLIVSGVVDKWAGVQFIDAGPLGDETLFASGGEGLLSIPLGSNLSIQNDVKYEYNEKAMDTDFTYTGPRYSFQGAAHLSWRDPMTGLFGAFGGVGTLASNNTFGGSEQTDFAFVGGEGQVYWDNFTFYAQGGYIDFPSSPVFAGLDEGLFARGVVRWFPTADSRLQLEGTYLNADYKLAADDLDVFSVEARYDFTLGQMPIVGDIPMFLAYRGTFRDNCNDFGALDMDDHTFMIGSSYSFSGGWIAVDRQGATLDTPDFGNLAACTDVQTPSDRRLKTDIAQLGTTADGIKLYSWKYMSDPVTTWVGVMAQDLVQTHPDAVIVGEDGFYRVRYDRLGVRMMTLEQWNARHL